MAERLHQRGAHIAIAGRDGAALAWLAGVLGEAPARLFDAYDLNACADTVTWANETLNGLDAVVVCVGSPALDRSRPSVTRSQSTWSRSMPWHPWRFCAPRCLWYREAVPWQRSPGSSSTRLRLGMADYTASKAALAFWLSSVRREQRRKGVNVLDLRLDHVESGFAQRAVVGNPPAMPRGQSVQEAVDKVMEALEGAALNRGISRLGKP